MKFLRFDAAGCEFPKPRVSPLPDRPQLLLRHPNTSNAKAPSHIRHFKRGQYALGAAYRLAGIGHTGTLLAPAYHCTAMLDPALALGADVLLYPLHADLSPDLTQLDALLAASARSVKSLLATHYFGFAKDFSRLRAWCDEHDITLIEDCSHVLCRDDFQAAGTGVYGRYVVASLYKFFASNGGGLLYSPHEALPDELVTRPAGLVDELRGIKRLIEKALLSGPTAADINVLDAQLAELRTRSLIMGREQIIERSKPSPHYRTAACLGTSFRSSQVLVSHTSLEHNIRRRRENYRQWSLAIANLGNCRPLFSELPEDCAPYMFALYLEHPFPHFYWLKQLGVPVWRWDEMGASSCAIAQDYRHHLIHLPCHQSLNADEMAWMVAAVKKALSPMDNVG